MKFSKSYPVLRTTAKFLLNRLSYPFSISIDVTYRCNLNCKHCYFKKQGYKDEISKEEWFKKIKEIKKSNDILHCTWVGGEPLLRKEIIEEGRKFFDFNWIVTNGTIEIPDWKDSSFFVSLDGTKKFNDVIRGKGTYDKTKQNIINSDSKIFLATVLNTKNYVCIEKMVKQWINTNVKGINFDFYTPLRKNDELFIPLNKRDEILDKILELKKDYGEFILLSKKAIELMKSQNYSKVIGRNCIVRKSTICLDPTGNIKRPCVMGKVDCSNCGCTIPYWVSAIFDKDLEMGKIMIKLIS